jgi:4-oxalocrotonate tautomerase
MPLVRISLRAGKPQEYQTAIADAVHRAMTETINVPALDRFQIITEHDPGQLIYDANYLDIKRTDDVVFIQITLNAGRTLEMKRAFYARVAELLHEKPGIRKEDVLINLVEVAKENWSFGNGEAQYSKP